MIEVDHQFYLKDPYSLRIHSDLIMVLPRTFHYLERVIVAAADDSVAPELQTCDDVVVVSFQRFGVLQRSSAPIHLDLVLPHISSFPFRRHQRDRRQKRRRERAGRRGGGVVVATAAAA